MGRHWSEFGVGWEGAKKGESGRPDAEKSERSLVKSEKTHNGGAQNWKIRT